MTNSYIGIISPRGLELLVLETEHAALFVFRRLARRCLSREIAFWTVLDEKVAGRIALQIQCGEYEMANQLLHVDALDLGTLLPPPVEERVICSIG